jgi:predicted DNA-binding protein (UPF0251 family)
VDALRSWLANGTHIFGVDPRRRLGRHPHARQALADDPRAGDAASGAWQTLASALHRHTVGGGMSELSAEERQVITLAYLEGRSNREIAAALGVSVSTVRRRLWAALQRLDAYISRTGAWLSAILLLGAGYVIDRTAQLGRWVKPDWTQRVASTVAATAVTAAAIGLTATIPDSTSPGTRAAAPAITAGSLASEQPGPLRLTSIGPAQTASVPSADRSHGPSPFVKTAANVITVANPPGTGSHHPNQGCDGNPTSAAPPVPVGRHSGGAPVSHPGKGGCHA